MGEPSCGVSQSGWPTTTRRSRSTPSRRYSRKAAAVLTSMRVAGVAVEPPQPLQVHRICRARSPASAEPRLPFNRVYRTNSCDSARYSSVWGREANQSASLPSFSPVQPGGRIQLRPLHRIGFADLRVGVARGKGRGIAQRRLPSASRSSRSSGTSPFRNRSRFSPWAPAPSRTSSSCFSAPPSQAGCHCRAS